MVCALVALGGLVVAGFLTWDHQVFHLHGDAGICAPGSGCEISRTSVLSEVPLPSELPGVPLALVGAAAYLALAGLAVGWALRPTEKAIWRVLLGIALLATVYSVGLAAYSLIKQGSLCPWCAILYAVNAALCGILLRRRLEPFQAWMESVGATLRSRPALAALGIFLGTGTAGYLAYARPLWDAHEVRERDLVAEAIGLPDRPSVPLDLRGRPSQGPPDAPVTVVVFTDFQCSHCRRLHETLEGLWPRWGDRVRLVLLHYPLDQSCHPGMTWTPHPQACDLAVLAECLHQQDRLWPLLGWLYADGADASDQARNQRLLPEGVDLARLDTCLGDPDILRRVTRDLEVGQGAEVHSTPTFFVNGRRVEGARPLEVLERMLSAMLDFERARSQGG
jgi:protein-disulfide isomerase/uncharacterized membrane protein